MDGNIIHLLVKRCFNNQVNLRIWGLIKGTITRNGVEIIKIAYEIQKKCFSRRANGGRENNDRPYRCGAVSA